MRKTYRLLGVISASVMLLMGCGGADGDYSQYVTLGDYTNLSVKLAVEKVTDKELEDYEKEQLGEYVTYEEVKGPVKDGQMVSVSLLAMDGDEIVYDFSDDGYDVVIGGEDFGSEVDEELIGSNIGDVLDFTVSYGDDFEDGSLSGREISYHVEIQSISDVIYPELTDEFVQEEFGEETADAWRDTLREELHSSHEADATETMRNDLAQQAVDVSQITGYPKELYKQKKEALQADYQGYADMLGCSIDEIYEMFELDEGECEQEYLDETYRTMVLAMIRQKEGIDLSEEQYQEKLQEYAKENEYDSVEALLEEYDEDGLKEYFLNEMTLDFLEEHADITVEET